MSLVDFWMDLMASADDCFTVSVSSRSMPISPVALFPPARWQIQQVCSWILCWPTSVSTRCMWSIRISRLSMAEAKFAVSSKIARTSVIAWPSTSSCCLITLMRAMPSSMPRNWGAVGDPFRVSSAIVSMWQSMSFTPALTSPEAVRARMDAMEIAPVQVAERRSTTAFCHVLVGRAPFRSWQRQQRRQQRQATTPQHVVQTRIEKQPMTTGMPKSIMPIM
mmetsp:Transcript_46388/g.137090  ORF Transcript_46388/g.137090 Transcript_46388/m.137090 type:complete len:221 (-) Transcript_46388:355-1017(-)